MNMERIVSTYSISNYICGPALLSRSYWLTRDAEWQLPLSQTDLRCFVSGMIVYGILWFFVFFCRRYAALLFDFSTSRVGCGHFIKPFESKNSNKQFCHLLGAQFCLGVRLGVSSKFSHKIIKCQFLAIWICPFISSFTRLEVCDQ